MLVSYVIFLNLAELFTVWEKRLAEVKQHGGKVFILIKY